LDTLNECENLWDLLSAYADGMASPDESERVRFHVARCAGCAQDLHFMRETAEVLADTPLVPPPPGLRDAIFAATIHRPTWRQQAAQALGRVFAPAPVRALAAAGVVAAVIGVTFLRGGGPASISGPDVSLAGAPDSVASVSTLPGKGQAPVAATARPEPGPALKRQPVTVAAAPRSIRPEPARDGSAVAVSEDDASAAVTPANLVTPVMPVRTQPRVSVPLPRRASSGGAAAPRRNSIKPAVKPSIETDLRPAEPMVPAPSDRMEVASGGMAVPMEERTASAPNTVEAAPPKEAASASAGTVRLVADARSSNADEMVSLANLRDSLRRDSGRPVAQMKVTNSRGAVWDVYKSHF
jgi:hypothetical protein